MSDMRLDVVGLGNAIVDVLAKVTDDSILDDHGLVKGSMRLCDEAEAGALYAAMPPGIERSGGSVANTMVGIASFGGRAGFVGKIRDDQLGTVFTHDIRAAGVEFQATPAPSGPGTGRCLVLISTDAQRTMSTALGIAGQLSPADVPPDVVRSADTAFLEGYLWEEPHAKQAMLRAMELAKEAGKKVAFTLSDPFCVERNRAEFVELVERSVDIVFANETEICSLFQTESFEEALGRVRSMVDVAALTRGEKGSVLVQGDRVEEVPAVPADVVDTTGAGDLYAAGVLFGLARGLDLRIVGQLGSAAAAEVISHVGARPEQPLDRLAAEILGA